MTNTPSSFDDIFEDPSFDDADLPESPLDKLLAKDLKDAAKEMQLPEVRYLVKTYYDIQTQRIASAHQQRTLIASDQPHAIISWTTQQQGAIENTIKKVLDYYTRYEPTQVATWSRSIPGVGPILAAGLLAHIDITKAPTVGHIWSFAGLNPTQVWEKGQKRPWNADLKVIQWKLGESFVKVQNRKGDIYGHIYATRRKLEDERNDQHLFADQAAHILATKKIRNTTDAYKFYSVGKLPPAHIYARSKRYAVKLFLSAWHEVAYFQHYKTLPPLPYAVTHLEAQHAHLFWPPEIDMLPDLLKAKQAQRPNTPLPK